jgi:general stress protein 26
LGNYNTFNKKHIYYLQNFKKKQTMSEIKNLHNKEAIDKLKELVDDINVCLFSTNLSIDDGATCRPMGVQKVCDEGNIWFYSDINSDKNREIKQDNKVQLFFSHPDKNSYMVVNGIAEIILDKKIIEDLWNPMAKIWFKDGKDDPNLSVVKVAPTSAYYWDMEGNKMINIFKMVASVVTGSKPVLGTQGELNI